MNKNSVTAYGREYVHENITEPLDDSIREINDSINSIREGRIGKNELCKEIIDLQAECQDLIREIHSSIDSDVILDVAANGTIKLNGGLSIGGSMIAVRPALWIDLET